MTKEMGTTTAAGAVVPELFSHLITRERERERERRPDHEIREKTPQGALTWGWRGVTGAYKDLSKYCPRKYPKHRYKFWCYNAKLKF